MRETLKIKEALKLMEMCVCVCVYSLTHIYIWRMGALVVVFNYLYIKIEQLANELL